MYQVISGCAQAAEKPEHVAVPFSCLTLKIASYRLVRFLESSLLLMWQNKFHMYANVI